MSIDLRSQPTAEDGKKYFTPDLFPLGYFKVHTGIGDDVAAGSIGGGTRCVATRSTLGSTFVETQFITHVLLAGGFVYREGGGLNDYINMTVKSPATVGVSNPGAGAFVKVPTGLGFNLFAPHPTASGDWDIDLAEKLNANVTFTKASPVPSGAQRFFDYDVSSDVLTVNGSGNGGYNLFDVPLPLTCHINTIPLFGSGGKSFETDSVKPALCLPHWIFQAEIYHAGGANSLEMTYEFTVGRKRTL